jgi:hypothetical protein
MYRLRTVVTVFRGFWDSLRYLVGVNGLPLIWDLLCVDHSLSFEVATALLTNLRCVVYLFVMIISLCICIYMYFYVNNGSIPFFSST